MTAEVEFFRDLSTSRWNWILRKAGKPMANGPDSGYANERSAKKGWENTGAVISDEVVAERTLPVLDFKVRR